MLIWSLNGIEFEKFKKPWFFDDFSSIFTVLSKFVHFWLHISISNLQIQVPFDTPGIPGGASIVEINSF